MNRIRKFDDKIINILNSELPTQSFTKDNDKKKPGLKCTQFKEEV